MNSLVSTSVSSALVVRVNPAITPRERDSTQGIMLQNIGQENQSVPSLIRNGNQPNLYDRKYWIINA